MAPNCACVPGAGDRPSPGCHAHPTRGSVAICSWSCGRLRPPFRAPSFNCRQISPKDLSCQAMEAGARPQRGLPGTLAIDDASVAAFVFPWHELHGNPAAPWLPDPACINGTCACRSSPWVGWRFTGWQFMQRGLSITLAASVNKATERACLSAIIENAEMGLRETSWLDTGETPPAHRRAATRPPFHSSTMMSSFVIRSWISAGPCRSAGCGCACP
jgi:hypothetical protein